jgi:CheY-like chemotaxis protein
MPESMIHRSACILLVDDNTCLRTGLKELLTRKGYRTMDAPDAEFAMTLLEQFGDEVQVLVTDIVLPGMTGFELARKVRSLYPRIGVVHISAYGCAEAVDDCFGEHVVLRKPITIGVLVQALERVLRRDPSTGTTG